MLVQEKRSIYLAIELNLREISYVLYAHALMCAHYNDAKFVRSRDAQCNTKESP